MNSPEAMIVFAREALGISESAPVEFFPLEGRGSDRTFFRLKWNNEKSAILIHYDPKRTENVYYADISLFLREIDVPVPRLIRHGPVECLILVEDLGNTDLWSLRETPWDTRRMLYEKVLVITHRLHSFPKNNFPSGRVKLMEGFGPHLYRWERDYFRDHFVKGICGIKLGPSFERDLEAELSALAQRLEKTARCLIHRDLQSHNVIFCNEEPFFIDFQGMRFGSPFYDLGSLLCDPYVNLSESQQEELLSFYYGLTKWDLNWASFRNTFWAASAQRLMQALGAYGFLGLKKGLKDFLEAIPFGLRNLQLSALQAGSLPRLQELSVECQRAMEKR
ncbi:MAG TPA: aminoglycoside phosphotransferase family protein [Thermodesulfobacteriota bacterium]|nr:aminoglycoside phosphotransferase family protein [Thermodesulfobacteriota bacterium]